MTLFNPPQVQDSYGYPICGQIILGRDRDGTVKIPPDMKQTVGFLHYFSSKSNQYEPLGTAFFIHVIREACVFNYIVTCKHVVKQCVDKNIPIYLRLNHPKERDVSYVQLRKEWIYHDESEVDLAVMNWFPTPPDPPVAWRTIDFEAALLSDTILASAGHTIKEGDEIVFLGLFAQYTGVKRNFPVFRFGHIALITDEKIMGEYGPADYLVIEGQAYKGFSGSPLFIAIERPSTKEEIFYLLGVVSNFYPEQKGVFVDPTTLEIYTHFGISLAAPIEKVVDILNGEKLMKARKEFIENTKKKMKPEPASNMIEDTGEGITRDEFFSDLRKIARPLKSQDGEEKSETSE